MTMLWNLLKSVATRMAPWRRALADRCGLMFNSFPRLGEAFGADDLPVSFIVERDSRREKAGNRKRRSPMPRPVVRAFDRSSAVRVAEHRPDARSTLRAHGDRRNDRRTA